jgi:hypothetical protein
MARRKTKAKAPGIHAAAFDGDYFGVVNALEESVLREAV